MFGRKLYKNILEGWPDLVDLRMANPGVAKFFIDLCALDVFIDQQMHRLTKHRGAADPSKLTHRLKRRRHMIAGHIEPPRSGRIDLGHLLQLIRLPAHYKLGHVNVTDMIATFRFVHVMRRHKKRHPLARKFEEQIPELAPRHWVDSRGWLVEKKHGGLVHERAGHGEALAPASGKLRRAPADERLEMRCLDHFVATLFQFFIAQAVKFAGKDEILING